MQRYCLGFVFDAPAESVLLLRKSRPDTAPGEINGLGGKVEPAEDYHDAMVREMQEEGGLTIPREIWRVFCQVDGPVDDPYTLVCFVARIADEQFERAYQYSIKGVKAYPINHLPWAEMVSDLNWIMPLAYQSLQTPLSASIRYRDMDGAFNWQFSRKVDGAKTGVAGQIQSMTVDTERLIRAVDNGRAKRRAAEKLPDKDPQKHLYVKPTTIPIDEDAELESPSTTNTK